MLPLHARAGCDYVLIARGGTTPRPWARLLDDLRSALVSLAAANGRPKTLIGPEAGPVADAGVSGSAKAS